VQEDHVNSLPVPMEYVATFTAGPLGFGLTTNKETQLHSVDQVAPDSQASKQQLKPGHLIIGINNIPINEGVTHAEILHLVDQQRSTQESFNIKLRVPDTALVSKESKTITITDEGGRIGILTEGRGADIIIVNLVVDGQGHKQHCELGDVVVGINGIALSNIMKDPSSCHELNEFIASTPRPMDLNLNSIGGPNDDAEETVNSDAKKVEKKDSDSAIKSGPATSTSQPDSPPLGQIAKLLLKGIQVSKMHANASIFSAPAADRILWIDRKMTTIYCAKEKGDPTNKKFPIHRIKEIRNMGNYDNKERRFAVVYDRGMLELEVSSKKARDAVATNLACLVKDLQAKAKARRSRSQQA